MYTIKEDEKNELIINKSKFIAHVYKVDNKTWSPTSWTIITPNETGSIIEFK